MPKIDPATVEQLRADARSRVDSAPQANATFPVARPPVARCRSCSAPVWWGTTAAGKSCPFNYDLVTATATRESHFRTCPQASQHSKRSRPVNAELWPSDA